MFDSSLYAEINRSVLKYLKGGQKGGHFSKNRTYKRRTVDHLITNYILALRRLVSTDTSLPRPLSTYQQPIRLLALHQGLLLPQETLTSIIWEGGSPREPYAQRHSAIVGWKLEKLEDRARAGRPCLKEARAPCIAVEMEAITSEAASGTSSAREAARRLGLPPSSVRNILRGILQLYPY
ncbi:uncharacterized protein TNCV_1620491 [Trichonephila clavipes]|nr:uncharacterized protein TNCV_1620491 [Trichonephila clavipes]